MRTDKTTATAQGDATEGPSIKDPVCLGFIPERGARLAVVILILLAVATYAFGTEALSNFGVTLLICAISGVAWVVSALVVAWTCVGSVKLDEWTDKHASNTKMTCAFIVASVIGGALTLYLFKIA